MATTKELYYEKRGNILVKNLKSRHFEAYYCNNKKEALQKALELIPVGASVGCSVAACVGAILFANAVKSQPTIAGTHASARINVTICFTLIN